MASNRLAGLASVLSQFVSRWVENTVLIHALLHVRLEGICWDISQDNVIWPVLIFQMSHLVDLYSFARLEKLKTPSMKDRFDLCVDIGIAIRDMHCNGNLLVLSI